MRIGRGDTGQLCGGLTLETQARALGGRRITLIFPISNQTEHLWRGTVSVEIGKTHVPIDIGEVPAGETRRGSIDLDVPPGSTEISGSLLIGP